MKNGYICGVRRAIMEDMVRDDWGDEAERIIAACREVEPVCMDIVEFIESCVDCGDAWGLTLLTGISRLFPSVYDAMPSYLGKETWGGLLPVLELCGIDSKKVM